MDAAVNARLLDGHTPITRARRNLHAVEAQANRFAEGLSILA
jgi:hypothetical protein